MEDNLKPSSINRREFLRAGATTTVAAALSGVSPAQEDGTQKQRTASGVLHTPLCELLNIQYPLLQAGMSGVAGPELVAEVSKAGGLGIMTGTLLPPDELRTRIRQVRAATDLPFGINLLLHTDLRPPRDSRLIPDPLLTSVQKMLNRFRTSLGLPELYDRPPTLPDMMETSFEIILEERVPVWSIGLGSPTSGMVDRCHARGIKVIAMVATVEDAVEVEAAGVDVIVAQGGEAGGHRSTAIKKESKERADIGTMALVPQVVDRVRAPVAAAGGISDGRGLAAALALGAQGVLIGTRFIATRESIAPEFHKQAVLESSSDATMITDVFTGMFARVLHNRFTDEYDAARTGVLPPFSQYLAAHDIYDAAAAQNRPDLYSLYCGQGVGSFSDIPSAGELVQRIIDEAREVLIRLGR